MGLSDYILSYILNYCNYNFDIMGIISPQETLGKWAERIPVFKHYIETYRAGLESEEWRANQYEAIMEEKESIEAERKDLEIESAYCSAMA